jgi:regulatory protein
VNKPREDALQKASDYAFLLLKFRLRSEKELYQRLKKRQFSEQIIHKTLAFLKEKQFVDDAAFARSWIQWRLKKSWGLTRIRQELNIKGIEKKVQESQINALKDSYCEEEVLQRLAEERFAKLKGLGPDKARRRLYAYLLRRGFSSELIIDTLSQLCSQIS